MVMASAGLNMPGDGSADPAASHECRLRRRRRFAPRIATSASELDLQAGAAAAAAAGEKRSRSLPSSSASSPSSSDDQEDGGSSEGDEACAAATAGVHLGAAPAIPAEASTAAEVWPVAFGSVSLAGRLREMEDTVSLRPALCTWRDGSPMHFFAVFDGHGGPHVAALCREQMHVILAEELAKQQEQEEKGAWRAALSRSFARVDALAAVACACGRAAASGEPACGCPLSGQTGGIVGSTAVVALLVRDRVVVANCGDSRAVLCRAAAPLPLSHDQKE